jgi:lipid II:glycine glycyltransferase (peptidoglycan interpeptide bridge formation enzyme)
MNFENDLSYPVDGGFLQSKAWEAFERESGHRIMRIESGNFFVLGIFNQLPLVGYYCYVPRGPILKIGNLAPEDERKGEAVGVLIQVLVEKARQQGAGWIRIEPQTEADLTLIRAALKGKYFLQKSRKNHQPAQTLMLDLNLSEEELLARMKSKTRYNIRLSKKKGVMIMQTREASDVERFCDLVEETAVRDGIVSHPREHYRKMLSCIKEEELVLLTARFQGKIIAGALVSFYGGVATYLHGASANENRNVMAPYSLQWAAIVEAKKRGCSRYDFGGVKIAEVKSQQLEKGNSWAGITRFKEGFCPDNRPVTFPGCYDVVLSQPKYYVYGLLQRIKSLV